MCHSHFTNDGPIIPTMQTRNCKKQGPAVQNMVERWPARFTERQVTYFLFSTNKIMQIKNEFKVCG